jgi:hypothetical protein
MPMLQDFIRALPKRAICRLQAAACRAPRGQDGDLIPAAYGWCPCKIRQAYAHMPLELQAPIPKVT